MSNPKHILLLSPFFHPEPISSGKYNTELAIALRDRGHRVTVVCSHPVYPGWKPKRGIGGPPGIGLLRGGLFVGYPSHTLLRRIVLEAWFAFHCLVQALAVRRQVDLVLAVLPPGLGPLIALKLFPKRVRKVVIVHDLQGVLASAKGSPLRRLAGLAAGWLEGDVSRSADSVIALSHTMREILVSGYGVLPERCAVRYPFAAATKAREGADALTALMPPGQAHVVYSGALGEKQAPDKLLSLMRALTTLRADVVCHVFSAGPVFDRLKRALDAEGFPRIHAHGLVARKDLPELHQRTTLHLLPQAAGTQAGAFPSKLSALLTAGVPVFALCPSDSEVATVLANTEHCGSTETPDAVEAAGLCSALIDKVRGIQHEQWRSASAALCEQFSLPALVEAVTGTGGEGEGTEYHDLATVPGPSAGEEFTPLAR